MMTFQQWRDQLATALDWGKEDDLVGLLRQHPVFVTQASAHQWDATPLQRMVYADMDQAVKNWIEIGSNVNVQDFEGCTALHAAADHGSVGLASLLLDKGADPNIACKGKTPLAHAAERRDEQGRQIADMLLQHGAVFDLTDAIWLNRDEDVRRILIDSPRSIHSCREPTRLLHNAIAVDVDGPTILRLLLEHDADPNLTDEELGPPLLEAVKSGSAEAVRLLLAHGADAKVRGTGGKTLLEIANEVNRGPEITALLREAGVQ